MAAALGRAGFEVRLVKDADNLAFDQAVRQFAADLKGAGTGLFYYAGHGVQLEGANYLIPVRPRMEDVPTVKARAMPVDTIVGLMEQSGVPTVLLFLDSCRDNPFPGASRSGSRGLSVVPTPRTRNSLIAYATSPGDTAADGDGRNGIFSGALLKQLANPGLELSALMKAVKAEVARQTDNRQNPRVDDGMKDDFYFLDPQVQAREAAARAEAAARELAGLEQALAERQALMDRTKSATEKKKLELEQQRQQALATASRIEADNLAREARRQAELAQTASQGAAERQGMADRNRQELETLASQVSLKQQQYASLVKDSRDPLAIRQQVRDLAATAEQLFKTYNELRDKQKTDIARRYALQGNELRQAGPEPTETDQEYAARLAAALKELKKQETAETDQAGRRVQAELEKATAGFYAEMNRLRTSLSRETWLMQGSDLKVTLGEWQRNTRQWPLSIDSTDPLIPWRFTGVIDWSKLDAAKLKQAYADLDLAIKAGALQAELEWQVDTKDWSRIRRNLRLLNVVTNATLWQLEADEPMGPLLDLLPLDLDIALLPMNGAGQTPVVNAVLGDQKFTLANRSEPRRLWLPPGNHTLGIKGVSWDLSMFVAARRGSTDRLSLRILPEGSNGVVNPAGLVARLERSGRGNAQEIGLIDLVSGQERRIPGQLGPGARVAALGADGTSLLLRDVDTGGLALWDLAKGQQVWEKLPVLNLTNDYATRALMSRDTRRALVLWPYSRRLTLVDLANGKQLANHTVSKQTSWGADNTPMGQLAGTDLAWVLVDDGPDPRVLVLDLAQPKTPPRELPVNKDGKILDLAMVGPDQGYMLLDTSTYSDREEKRSVRRVPDGSLVNTLPAGFLPQFFAAGTPGTICGWQAGRLVQVDVATGATIRDWGPYSGRPTRVLEQVNVVLGQDGGSLYAWLLGH